MHETQPKEEAVYDWKKHRDVAETRELFKDISENLHKKIENELTPLALSGTVNNQNTWPQGFATQASQIISNLDILIQFVIPDDRTDDRTVFEIVKAKAESLLREVNTYVHEKRPISPEEQDEFESRLIEIAKEAIPLLTFE